jgi:hypothetical protein
MKSIGARRPNAQPNVNLREGTDFNHGKQDLTTKDTKGHKGKKSVLIRENPWPVLRPPLVVDREFKSWIGRE